MHGSGILFRMTTAAQTLEKLHESADAAFDRIDRDEGVIRGVRILGLQSSNGRRYTEQACRKAVEAGLYEGAPVYLDHKYQGDRQRKERWGKLRNVRLAEDGGIVGDLQYLKTHPETEQTLEAAERFQDIGLSHDSMGHSELKEGERIVTEIVKVNSVDLVEKPATTENLFESERGTMKKNLLAVLRENRKSSKVAEAFLNRLTEMGDLDPEMMDEMAMDEIDVELPEEEAAAVGDEAVKQALRTAILAVLDGPDDSATTMKKIKMLMDTGDKVSLGDPAAAAGAVENDGDGEEGGEEGGEGADDNEEVIPESIQAAVQSSINAALQEFTEGLKPQLDHLNQLTESATNEATDSECRKLLESAGRDVTDERMTLLRATESDKRQALVDSWPKAGRRPLRSPAKVTESQGRPGSYEEARSNVRALATAKK